LEGQQYQEPEIRGPRVGERNTEMQHQLEKEHILRWGNKVLLILFTVRNGQVEKQRLLMHERMTGAKSFWS
jgi:hypothetical protein